MPDPLEKPVVLPDGETIWLRILSIFLPEPCLKRAMGLAALSGIHTKSGAITHVLRQCLIKKEEPRDPRSGRAA